MKTKKIDLQAPIPDSELPSPELPTQEQEDERKEIARLRHLSEEERLAYILSMHDQKDIDRAMSIIKKLLPNEAAQNDFIIKIRVARLAKLADKCEDAVRQGEENIALVPQKSPQRMKTESEQLARAQDHEENNFRGRRKTEHQRQQAVQAGSGGSGGIVIGLPSLPKISFLNRKMTSLEQEFIESINKSHGEVNRLIDSGMTDEAAEKIEQIKNQIEEEFKKEGNTKAFKEHLEKLSKIISDLVSKIQDMFSFGHRM